MKNGNGVESTGLPPGQMTARGLARDCEKWAANAAGQYFRESNIVEISNPRDLYPTSILGNPEREEFWKKHIDSWFSDPDCPVYKVAVRLENAGQQDGVGRTLIYNIYVVGSANIRVVPREDWKGVRDERFPGHRCYKGDRKDEKRKVVAQYPAGSETPEAFVRGNNSEFGVVVFAHRATEHITECVRQGVEILLKTRTAGIRGEKIQEAARSYLLAVPLRGCTVLSGKQYNNHDLDAVLGVDDRVLVALDDYTKVEVDIQVKTNRNEALELDKKTRNAEHRIHILVPQQSASCAPVAVSEVFTHSMGLERKSDVMRMSTDELRKRFGVAINWGRTALQAVLNVFAIQAEMRKERYVCTELPVISWLKELATPKTEGERPEIELWWFESDLTWFRCTDQNCAHRTPGGLTSKLPHGWVLKLHFIHKGWRRTLYVLLPEQVEEFEKRKQSGKSGIPPYFVLTAYPTREEGKRFRHLVRRLADLKSGEMIPPAEYRFSGGTASEDYVSPAMSAVTQELAAKWL